MASFDMDRQILHEAFRLMANCPLCQTKYQPNLARVLAEKDDAYLLHVPCAKCHGAVVALVLANSFGVSSMGVLTDLSGDEVLAMKGRFVDADDVLEVYQAMKEGTFTKQFIQ